MNKSLSDSDITSILNKNNIFPKIITYKELPIRAEELLEDLQIQPLIICIETRRNYGHWTCLFIDRFRQINFFDPYGLVVDKELDWGFDPKFKKQVKEDFPYLTKLLYNLGNEVDVEYNNHKFQKKGKGITTCGRHCCVRLVFQELSSDEYNQLINLLCDKTNLDPDSLVLKLTEE